MKKLALSITVGLILALSGSVSHAEISLGETVKKLPNVKQGVVYSLRNSEFSHVSTASVLEKGDFALEAGYSDNGKLVGVVSYELVNAKKYIDISVLKELMFRPGAYYAMDEINSGVKHDWGISATLLEVKF